MSRFLNSPPSVRASTGTIVSATLVVVVVSGVLMRLLDGDEYATVGDGMWWAIQTVTTVGYGDVTPSNVTGRLVAALVMLQGLAFLAIVTAAITSSFVARASREYDDAQAKEEVIDQQKIEARLDAIDRKLDTLAASLASTKNT